jgi:bifunctional NMN adenylyltransferase/nudix hydrolase
MTKKYHACVFIGRFQPFHNAHLEIFKKAAKLAEKVIVIIGSSQKPRTFENPFSDQERYDFLNNTLSSLGYEEGIDFSINFVRDTLYNNTAWIVRVQSIVNCEVPTEKQDKIAIIGHKKDETSYYLDCFKQWDLIEMQSQGQLSATDIRNLYFKQNSNLDFIQGVVSRQVMDSLIAFKNTREFEQIIRERQFQEKYQQQYSTYPYPPTFVTVDAVVIQSGHVLMVTRKSEPGKGLMALPGGFLNADTDPSLEYAMLRELKEETGIKVPPNVLRGNIKKVHVFDAIKRSARGRTITHAFNICLPDGELPKVRGSSDATSADWVPLSIINPGYTFEDHYEIISFFTGI